MNRRCWICNDVWMDILPSFDHAQLGLKMALLSPRFDALVDKHFDGKSELTIWRPITICKDAVAAVPNLAVLIDQGNSDNFVPFPLPNHSLPNKIRFNNLWIEYIDHSVIAFLRANQQIFDKGTHLGLYVRSVNIFNTQSIWDVLVRQIWPIFAPNIRHLGFHNADALDNLRCRISPTILSDCNQLNSIHSGFLCPDAIAYDGPNATAGQALSKWLHIPGKDGQAKHLTCNNYSNPLNVKWANNFKKTFLNATSYVRYKIQFFIHQSTPIVPFELMNGRTNEKLTLIKANENKPDNRWIMKRCQIGETKAVQWEEENWDHLNNIIINLLDVICSGPLSPPEQQQ